MGAIIVQDLEKRRKQNYTFSWTKALNFSFESGITLQYAHARLCSIERNFDSAEWIIDGKDAAKLLVDEPDAFKLMQVRKNRSNGYTLSASFYPTIKTALKLFTKLLTNLAVIISATHIRRKQNEI